MDTIIVECSLRWAYSALFSIVVKYIVGVCAVDAGLAIIVRVSTIAVWNIILDSDFIVDNVVVSSWIHLLASFIRHISTHVFAVGLIVRWVGAL